MPVTSAGRQDRDIAGIQFQASALHPTEFDDGMAACHAEDLVNLRMIVDEVVNAVAPGSAPTVRLEQGVNNNSRFEPIRKAQGATIDNQRPVLVVGDDAVIAETQSA